MNIECKYIGVTPVAANVGEVPCTHLTLFVYDFPFTHYHSLNDNCTASINTLIMNRCTLTGCLFYHNQQKDAAEAGDVIVQVLSETSESSPYLPLGACLGKQ